MTSSHSVDILDSGFVFKTANTAEFNEKLKTEVQQIQALHGIYPKLMVPVLHTGLVGGRHFYILEKKSGASLASLVFDATKSIEYRNQIIKHALDSIKTAVKIECSQPIESTYQLHQKIRYEWDSLKQLHSLFDKPAIIEGKIIIPSGRAVVERALAYAEEEIFLASSTSAHCNFHFGNVLYDETLNEISFIDPDGSVQGIDPYFGFSRFAFSFWHELAAEIRDSINIVPLEKSVLFLMKHDQHRQMLDQIPVIRSIHEISNWIGEENYRKFYALTTYCFLRSMRINGSKDTWMMPSSPRAGTPEETLYAGLMFYLESLSSTVQ